MKKIISLAKRRGFVYPSSEIYGGLANVYDYGPLGSELLRNLRELWWKTFIHEKENIVGIESQILMHPQVWVASGHVAGFHDPMVEDKETNKRYRADHLIEDWAKDKEEFKDLNIDSMDVAGLADFIKRHNIKSPDGNDVTEPKEFNLLMKTQLGSVEGEKSHVYLRGETAQGMFVDFKSVLDSTRQKVPFGIAQHGKAFRNEITTGKFIYRTLEFEQMEIQYFIEEKNWEVEFENWREEIERWNQEILGIEASKFRWKPHHPDKMAHYAKKAEDFEYEFSFGWGEVNGLHYRTDFDLKTHMNHANTDLSYRDPYTQKTYIPHVVESTWGLNRHFFMVLEHYFREDETRTYLQLPSKLAPYKVAVFPLVSNKEEIVTKAKVVFDTLKSSFHTYWDDRGNIGKRYRYQDEIGTPYCLTIDYDTLKDDTVTLRDRDSMQQERIPISHIEERLSSELQ